MFFSAVWLAPGFSRGLIVGDQTSVDTYYPNQPDWTLEEIDVFRWTGTTSKSRTTFGSTKSAGALTKLDLDSIDMGTAPQIAWIQP